MAVQQVLQLCLEQGQLAQASTLRVFEWAAGSDLLKVC